MNNNQDILKKEIAELRDYVIKVLDEKDKRILELEDLVNRFREILERH